MVNPYLRFTIKRRWRQIKQTPSQVVDFFSQNIFRSGKKYARVRRFSLSWLLFIAVLLSATMTQITLERRTILASVPAPGGTHREAVVGELDNFNPLFAVDGANADVSRLIFAGLSEYAVDGSIIGEMAEDWQANDTADEFTVKLRPNLTWHDGEVVTAEDIVFTIGLIQNPDTRSPLKDTWRGIEVEQIDDQTVKFSLPNPFAPFPQLLTVGILPQHILQGIEPKDLRVDDFNIRPIGSGAFSLTEFDVSQNRVILDSFDNYAQGKPKLSRLIVAGHESLEEAKSVLDQKLVDALGSLTEFYEDEDDSLYETQPGLAVGNYLFMNSSRSLFKNNEARQAIVHAIDNSSILEAIENKRPIINSAFLPIQLQLKKNQEQLPYDVAKATKLLNDEGWKLDAAATVLRKEGNDFSFRLAVANRPTQIIIAENIAQQLAKVGIKVEIQQIPSEDFQAQIALSRKYDAALIGITNGIDPDVFVFWHSSQAEEGGLNFANIKDDDLDTSLEAGRTRTNRKLRNAKYEAFAERWRELAPAKAINQELYHYVRRDRAVGEVSETLLKPSQRFDNVENWTVLFNQVEKRYLSDE